MSTPTFAFVVPGDVADVTAPSGGNTYDRRISRALAAAGRPVRDVAVAGTWPWPDDAARARLAGALAGLADDAVVLLDGLVACGVPEVIGAQAGRLRLAILVHLPLADETGLAPGVAADLDARERETLHAASAVVATSTWTARRLIAHHGLAAGRVHAVPPGTDPAPLAPGTDGRSRLVCVASVTPRKGQDLLVAALAQLGDRPPGGRSSGGRSSGGRSSGVILRPVPTPGARSRPPGGLPWSCECVGPVHRAPEYVARLRRLIERHGLGDRITLAGPRTGAELAGDFAAADLTVLPSRAEPYGMVVTEALARGIPVLATAVDGIPESLGRAPDGNVPGILVPPDDAMALAGALRRWFTEPGLRHRLRAAARLRRGTLAGWDTAARQLADILTTLPAGGDLAPGADTGCKITTPGSGSTG